MPASKGDEQMRKVNSVFVLAFALALAATPEGAAQLPPEPPKESVDSLREMLKSKKADERVYALTEFSRIYDDVPVKESSWQWREARLNDLCRALCDQDYSVRLFAAEAFVKLAARPDRLLVSVREKDRLVHLTDYLIRAMQLKFDDLLLETDMGVADKKLANSVKQLSAASLAAIYKQNAEALPALKVAAKKTEVAFKLERARADLAIVEGVQESIIKEGKPILTQLQKPDDKSLSAVATKALEILEGKKSK
jgi:hypothetical protein